ncbi:hypothetical protein C8B47_22085 [filamentous cyanobacterium CCP4]|nr:hypothetical protein C8B47_22085 [filamentous cyanobacterium CCP4]
MPMGQGWWLELPTCPEAFLMRPEEKAVLTVPILQFSNFPLVQELVRLLGSILRKRPQGFKLN